MTAVEENIKIGQDVLDWLNQMPEISAVHQMLVALAFSSTTQNGGEFNEPVAKAADAWAQMLCQNLELIGLFYKGALIAHCGEDGFMEVDFSKEAEELVAKAQQLQLKQNNAE